MLSTTEKRSRNYHDHYGWKKVSPKTDRLRKKPMSVPLWGDKLLLFRVASCFHLFFLEYRVIFEKERGKSRKGKNIRYANGRKSIKSLPYGSPLDYELSLLFGSVCRTGSKQWKKEVRVNIMIIIIIIIIIMIIINKQKRVSQTFKVCNSFENDGIEIKGLLEPAHSCYGLSLYWFLGLDEYRYSWIRFMWTFKTYGINVFFYFWAGVW